MKAEIISVGTELLLGQIANTDAQYISQCLSEIGIGVYFHTAVGDNWERIRSAAEIADSRSDILIFTGGLGPTVDDITKEVVCEYLGLKTVVHKKSYDRLCDRFAKMNRTVTENNLKQILFPEEAVVLDNDCGTAPGMYYERNGKIYIALPGPPFELKTMFSRYAMPLLRRKSSKIIKSRVLRIYGIGESAMENKVRDILDSQTNPTIAPLLGNGDVTLRITAMSDNENDAAKIIAPVETCLRERLGSYVYGTDNDTPESVLVDLLLKSGKTISAAESCTGGLIASRITDVPGASGVLKESFVTYSNEAKHKYLGVKECTLQEYGAVSEQTALEMAYGLIMNTGCDVAISVTGIAGPGGGTPEKPVGLVYTGTALKTENGIITNVRQNNFVGTRDKIKFNAATTAIIYAVNMIKKQDER